MDPLHQGLGGGSYGSLAPGTRERMWNQDAQKGCHICLGLNCSPMSKAPCLNKTKPWKYPTHLTSSR